MLLVDDDPLVLRSTGRLLEVLGLQCTTAPGGRQALELFAAATESWSLVVCDVLMPDLDGPATVKALRAQRAAVPVLFVSGYTPDPSILTSSARTRFLGKPFSAAALTSALQQFLPGR